MSKKLQNSTPSSVSAPLSGDELDVLLSCAKNIMNVSGGEFGYANCVSNPVGMSSEKTGNIFGSLVDKYYITCPTPSDESFFMREKASPYVNHIYEFNYQP